MDGSTLATILNCGIADVERIARIDCGILEQARDSIAEQGMTIDFVSLYTESAMVACSEVGLGIDNVEIDSNYLCASIHVKKATKNQIKELEEFGFTVYE